MRRTCQLRSTALRCTALQLPPLSSRPPARPRHSPPETARVRQPTPTPTPRRCLAPPPPPTTFSSCSSTRPKSMPALTCALTHTHTPPTPAPEQKNVWYYRDRLNVARGPCSLPVLKEAWVQVRPAADQLPAARTLAF